ncbi:MAG: succinate dehydrogenase assembly factor 2 [Methyloglobulus sp.]|nr:succinate dehydrogenase assembly factor 2 [Methyloglobulus sp.]
MGELAKLRWQCRRGSKELDLLLMSYLETRYPVADAAEKAHFAEMLKLDDVELMMQRDVYWSCPPQK